MKTNPSKWLLGLVAVFSVVIIGYVDLITGYELNFFVFYFLPVSLAAWFIGLSASVWLGILSAIVWYGADARSGHLHSIHFYAVWNTMVRLASFIAIGGSLARIRQLLDHERVLVEDLRRSLSEVKVLESVLPICCRCKKIRDQDGSWQQLESYIIKHSDSQFSHGYCPECAKEAMAAVGFTD
ncbi:MAG TPA: hypothetical protein PLL30_01020 [Candidatus Krumholzibacteria bacterium]|nr:hypothetical protein [Candidatus Krumholzibacteria bacterium]HPD70343.1 hypothetical protein [Candidatus Krumholzibacteria bacterium]HRY39957.1 hypothetical protein [Candidatus Krumholzibacteria bacterium]